MMATFDELRTLIKDLPGGDLDAAEAARLRDSQLTKPPGSLGKLEDIACWLATWQGQATPRADTIACMVFAGNHGVTERGVSAFPAAVTHQMVANFEAGGAAINQLARMLGARLKVTPLQLEQPTGDFTTGPAMTEDETCAAITIGFDAVEQADIACIGEMGIGNTTSAAALGAALFGGCGLDWAGPGTGLDEDGVTRKAAVIDQGLARHRCHRGDPLHALACLGGREIAAMVGAMVACRLERTPVILDGYVSCAAAAVLACLEPRALDHCLAGHVSAEPAAGRLLAHLSREPLLDLGMRLGEGSGAACAALIVKAAVNLHDGMATFAEAGVADRKDAEAGVADRKDSV